MIDMLKKNVEVGDYVIHTGGEYKGLAFGRVLKVTPKTLLLATTHQGCYKGTLRTFDVVKINHADMEQEQKEKLDIIFEREVAKL